MFFFALAQIVLAFAPLIEGRRGGDARAHVESAGTGIHYAHNEANCSACVARQLLSSSEPAPDISALFDRVIATRARTRSAFVPLASQPNTRPRAPPLYSV